VTSIYGANAGAETSAAGTAWRVIAYAAVPATAASRRTAIITRANESLGGGGSSSITEAPSAVLVVSKVVNVSARP
jgi:hypothetical protein